MIALQELGVAWPEIEILQEVLAQLPRYRQVTLLDKLKSRSDREWYFAKSIGSGWSRNFMWHQISTAPHLRSGNK